MFAHSDAITACPALSVFACLFYGLGCRGFSRCLRRLIALVRSRTRKPLISCDLISGDNRVLVMSV